MREARDVYASRLAQQGLLQLLAQLRWGTSLTISYLRAWSKAAAVKSDADMHECKRYLERNVDIDWQRFLLAFGAMCFGSCLGALPVILTAMLVGPELWVLGAWLWLFSTMLIVYFACCRFVFFESEPNEEAWYYRPTEAQLLAPSICRQWRYPFIDAPLMLFGTCFGIYAVMPAVILHVKMEELRTFYVQNCIGEPGAAELLAGSLGDNLGPLRESVIIPLCQDRGSLAGLGPDDFRLLVLRYLGLSRWEFYGPLCLLGVLYWMFAIKAVRVRHLLALRDTILLAKQLKYRNRRSDALELAAKSRRGRVPATHDAIEDPEGAPLLSSRGPRDDGADLGQRLQRVSTFDRTRSPWFDCFDCDNDHFLEVMDVFIEKFYLIGSLNSMRDLDRFLVLRDPRKAPHRVKSFEETVVVQTKIQSRTLLNDWSLYVAPILLGALHAISVPLYRTMVEGKDIIPSGLGAAMGMSVVYQCYVFSLFVYNLIACLQEMGSFVDVLQLFHDKTHTDSEASRDSRLQLVQIEDIQDGMVAARPLWENWQRWVRTRKSIQVLLSTPRIRVNGMLTACVLIVLCFLVGTLVQTLEGDGLVRIDGRQAQFGVLSAGQESLRKAQFEIADGLRRHTDEAHRAASQELRGEWPEQRQRGDEEDDDLREEARHMLRTHLDIISGGLLRPLQDMGGRLGQEVQVHVDAVSKFQIMGIFDVMMILVLFAGLVNKIAALNGLLEEQAGTLRDAKQRFIEVSPGTLRERDGVPSDTLGRMGHYVDCTKDANGKCMMQLFGCVVTRSMIMGKAGMVILLLWGQLQNAAPQLAWSLCNAVENQVQMPPYQAALAQLTRQFNQTSSLQAADLRSKAKRLEVDLMRNNSRRAASRSTAAPGGGVAPKFRVDLTANELLGLESFVLEHMAGWAAQAANLTAAAIDDPLPTSTSLNDLDAREAVDRTLAALRAAASATSALQVVVLEMELAAPPPRARDGSRQTGALTREALAKLVGRAADALLEAAASLQAMRDMPIWRGRRWQRARADRRMSDAEKLVRRIPIELSRTRAELQRLVARFLLQRRATLDAASPQLTSPFSMLYQQFCVPFGLVKNTQKMSLADEQLFLNSVRKERRQERADEQLFLNSARRDRAEFGRTARGRFLTDVQEGEDLALVARDWMRRAPAGARLRYYEAFSGALRDYERSILAQVWSAPQTDASTIRPTPRRETFEM